MTYIKASETIPHIPDGLKQTFQKPIKGNVSHQIVARMKNDGTLTDRDLAIATFLFRYRFATIEQIYEYLKLMKLDTLQAKTDGEVPKETSIISIRNRLEKLISYRIVNKFQLGIVEDDMVQPDALHIYCLDLGGKFLLANYSNEDTSDWTVTHNLKSSCHISKDLVVTNIYLKLLRNCGSRLVAFEKNPLRKCENISIIPTFDFTIEYMGGYRHFVCEVIKDFDMPIEFRKKAIKLEKLLKTNAWKKYYFGSNAEPVLLLFAEDDNLALDVGRVISGQTEIESFRISTEERAMDLSFLKYIPEEDKLKKVKTSVFLPQ